jgi:arginase family enzyme
MLVDAIVPAVDDLLPDGLSRFEIEEVSAPLAHPKAVGKEITTFNPRLDADGNGAKRPCGHAVQAFRQMRKLFSMN